MKEAKIKEAKMKEEQKSLFQIIDRLSSLKNKLEVLLLRVDDKNANYLHQTCIKCKSCFVYHKKSENSRKQIHLDGNLMIFIHFII